MRRNALTIGTGLVGVAGCILAAILAVAFTSRPSAIAREQLVGTYEVTFPFGHSSLHLAADGRYTQAIEIDGQRASTSGTWTHEARDWFADVTLRRPLHPTDGFGRMNHGWKTPFTEFFVMPITRKLVVLGAIEIAFDEEFAYTKVD